MIIQILYGIGREFNAVCHEGKLLKSMTLFIARALHVYYFSSYFVQEGSSHGSSSSQSPIGELSLRRLSERLSDPLDNRPSSPARPNGRAEPTTVENDAFNIMGDDHL